MRCPTLSGLILRAVACVAAASVSAGVAGEPKTDPEQLLATLEKGDFDARQEAFRKLEALGEAARPALETALKGSEVFEVREAAERLLENLRRAILVVELYDPQGRPVPKADLRVNLWPVRTSPNERYQSNANMRTLALDDAGRGELKGLRPGPYQLNVDGGGQLSVRYSRIPSPLYLHGKENFLQCIRPEGGVLKGVVLAAQPPSSPSPPSSGGKEDPP
jgi:hypothetical protein